MMVDDAAGSGDPSEQEKEMGTKAPASEMDGDVEVAAPASEAQTPAEEARDPKKWKWAIILLCFYGFMGSIKPGEPFITPYLLSSEKNFTQKQVTNEITPVLTYSYMAVLVPAFLLTDLLRYKPVLVVQSISHVLIWVILLLGHTLLQMQFMEFFYGVTMACRVAYSSYIFSLVSPALYQRVASYSRSAVLLGVFTSSVLGQLCLSLGDISFRSLSAISLGFVSVGLLLSLCLPWPRRSLFFNRTQRQQQSQALERERASHAELDQMNPADQGSTPSASTWKELVLVQMLLELRNVVKRPNLRLWSLWWIFNSSGYYLVLFYVHLLWNQVLPITENKRVYNGGVEAASTLLSAITSFMAGYVKIRWSLWSELVICIITALQTALLLLMVTTDNIWVCYNAYVLFRGFYQFLVPIATFQIASSLTRELCALVFGINTFLGTALKSIINLIFSDRRGLGLNVRDQFKVYLAYFALLTAAYLVCAAVVLFRHFRNERGGGEGGGAGDQTTPTELGVVAGNLEAQPLSNGKNAKVE